MKTIQILSPDNGVGLTRDRDILIRILSDHYAVMWRDPNKPKEFSAITQKADINIHLEIVYEQQFKTAHSNILIPNPEWFFSRMWTRYIRQFDAIFAKTKDTERIFKNLGAKNVVYTSFTSEDKYNPTVKRERSFAHFAGRSSAKGTTQVLEAAARIKDIPISVFSFRDDHTKRISDDEFNQLFNKHLFHLCPSSYEGFGHYINEAKSVGAIIITSNAAPMNELVKGAFGFGCSGTYKSMQNLAHMFEVNVDSLENMIRVLNDMPSDLLNSYSQKARESYLDNDKYFKEVLIHALKKF